MSGTVRLNLIKNLISKVMIKPTKAGEKHDSEVMHTHYEQILNDMKNWSSYANIIVHFFLYH